MPPVPALPEGMTLAYFGQQVMRWGSGDEQAIERMDTITATELVTAGITVEMAENWRLFYVGVVTVSPSNPSARGRASLMEYARELLKEVTQ